MTYKLLKRINQLSFTSICLFIILTNLIFFIFAEFYQYDFCTNNRAEFFLANLKDSKNGYYQPYKGFAVLFDECLKNSKCNLRNIDSTDDIGSGLTFWIANKITPVSNYTGEDVFKFRDSRNYPAAAKVFFIALHFLMLILLTFLGKKTLGNMTTLFLGLMFCFFENIFFITYSNDVYLFPVYTMILCFLLLRPQIFKMKYFILAGLTVGLFCWFRSSSWPIFVSSSIVTIIVSYKIRDWFSVKKVAAFALIGILIFKLPTLYFKNTSHVFWHSMHAGLFQYGGIRDINDKMIPIALVTKNNKFEKKPFALFGWADQIQYQTVRLFDPKIKIYSTAYEEYLKKDYLNLISNAPFKALVFYLKRLPKMYSFNPFKDHLTFRAPNNDIMIQSLIVNDYSSLLFSIFFAFIFIFFIATKLISQNIKIVVSVFCLTGSLSSFLIHSGYITYNVPILFTQWLIIFHLISVHLNNYYKVCNSNSSAIL